MKKLLLIPALFISILAYSQEYCTVKAFGSEKAKFEFDFGSEKVELNKQYDLLKMKSTTDVINLMIGEKWKLDWYQMAMGTIKYEVLIFTKPQSPGLSQGALKKNDKP